MNGLVLAPERSVWLVLVGHADRLGIVTRCPISTIADYTRLSRAQTLLALEQLERTGAIHALATPGRRRHYRLLGDWLSDRGAAQHLMETETTRVRSLQNRRSRIYATTQPDARIGPPIRIVNLDTATQGKFQFTLQIAGVGTVYHCAVIQRQDGTHYLSEPAKRLGAAWVKTCTIDASLASDVIDAVLFPERQRHLEWAAPPEIRIGDLASIAVDGVKCRLKLRFTLLVPGIVTVRDCAVIEQLDGTHILSGPSKIIAAKWSKTVALEHLFAQRIISAVLAKAGTTV